VATMRVRGGFLGAALLFAVTSVAVAAAPSAPVDVLVAPSPFGVPETQIALSQEGRLWLSDVQPSEPAGRRVRLVTRNVPGGLGRPRVPKPPRGYGIGSYQLASYVGTDRAALAWSAQQSRPSGRVLVQAAHCTPYACGRVQTLWSGTPPTSPPTVAAAETPGHTVVLWTTSRGLMWAAGGQTRFGAARPLSRGTMPVLAMLGNRGVQAAWIDRGNVRAAAWSPARGFGPPQTVGRGSAEVQLGVSDHDVLIAWRTDPVGGGHPSDIGRVRVASRSLSAHGFSRPQTVYGDEALDLCLDENHAGRAALGFGAVTLAALDGSLVTEAQVSLREPGGQFGSPVVLPSSVSAGFGPRVAVDDAGTATASWLHEGSPATYSRHDVLFAQSTPGGSFSTPTAVGTAASTQVPLVAASNQRTVIAWDNGAHYSEVLLGNEDPQVLPGNPVPRAVGEPGDVGHPFTAVGSPGPGGNLSHAPYVGRDPPASHC
jgi:hypothetical protein